ncbi:MAG: flagellar assembly protein FliW [Lachnospiraceae bacterium]|nr:flagellar assembly protein FliW [Lachnospiraceae bacterium]
MLVKTRHFGEIDLDENKIITFEDGIIGFENYKRYTILYNNEDGNNNTISWLQSLDEPELALPVISPLTVMADYNPIVEDEVLQPLGELTEENVIILLTLSVPSDLTKMTANMKAPLVINADTKKGCQIIAENPDYMIKYNIYDQVKKSKEAKGE